MLFELIFLANSNVEEPQFWFSVIENTSCASFLVACLFRLASLPDLLSDLLDFIGRNSRGVTSPHLNDLEKCSETDVEDDFAIVSGAGMADVESTMFDAR